MKQDLDTKTRRSILRARKIGLLLRGRNSGQAVVEYILIVSVAIGIIFMLKPLFGGMEKYVQNYVGDYIECLMTHGELPALGVTDSELKKHLDSSYTCNMGYQPFTLAEGRPPVGGNTSDPASRVAGGKSDAQGGSDSSSSSRSSRGGSKDSSDKDSEASGGGRGGSGSGGNPYANGSIRRGGRTTADGIAGGGSDRQRLIDEEGEGDELGGSGRKRKPRQSRIIYRERPRYKAILGNEAEQVVNKSERSTVKRKPSSRPVAKSEGLTFSGPRTGFAKQPPDKPPVVEETKDGGWGFGKLLKWLLIIGMIVALLIFFGGQLLNYSNSDSS